MDVLERRKAFLNVQGGQRLFLVDVAFSIGSADELHHVQSQFYVKGNTHDGQRRTALNRIGGGQRHTQHKHEVKHEFLPEGDSLLSNFPEFKLVPAIECPANKSTLEKRAKFHDTPFVDQNEVIVSVPDGVQLRHVHVLRIYNERHRAKGDGEPVPIKTLKLAASHQQTEESVTSSILTWKALPEPSSVDGRVVLPWCKSDVCSFTVNDHGEITPDLSNMLGSSLSDSGSPSAVVPDLKLARNGSKKNMRRPVAAAVIKDASNGRMERPRRSTANKISWWTGDDDDDDDESDVSSTDVPSSSNIKNNNNNNNNSCGRSRRQASRSAQPQQQSQTQLPRHHLSPSSDSDYIDGILAAASASDEDCRKAGGSSNSSSSSSNQGYFSDDGGDWMKRLTSQAPVHSEENVFGHSLSSNTLVHSLSSPQFSPIPPGSSSDLTLFSIDYLAAMLADYEQVQQEQARQPQQPQQQQQQQLHQLQSQSQPQQEMELSDEQLQAQLDEQLLEDICLELSEGIMLTNTTDTTSSNLSHSSEASSTGSSPATVPCSSTSTTAVAAAVSSAVPLTPSASISQSLSDCAVLFGSPPRIVTGPLSSTSHDVLGNLTLLDLPSQLKHRQQNGFNISSPQHQHQQQQHQQQQSPIVRNHSGVLSDWLGISSMPVLPTPQQLLSTHAHAHLAPRWPAAASAASFGLMQQPVSSSSSSSSSNGSSSFAGLGAGSVRPRSVTPPVEPAAASDSASTFAMTFLGISSSERKRVRTLLSSGPRITSFKSYVSRFKSLVTDARDIVFPAP